MHELAIAQSLLNIVLEEIANHNIGKVVKIVIKIGTFVNLMPKALTFCFDLIKKGTVAAEAILEFIFVPMVGKCLTCNSQLDFSEPIFCCNYCDSKEIVLTQGRELYIEHLEIVENNYN